MIQASCYGCCASWYTRLLKQGMVADAYNHSTQELEVELITSLGLATY